jgi:hypothetical protein
VFKYVEKNPCCANNASFSQVYSKNLEQKIEQKSSKTCSLDRKEANTCNIWALDVVISEEISPH